MRLVAKALLTASAQASANLAIDVSPNARIGIEVRPSVLGKGNLVNAQIIAFLNSTLDFSATVTGSVGTGTNPTYSYKYGAYLYYNLGYGGFANVLGDTWNWHFTPVFLYSIPGQRYTIYENSNVESDVTLNSKRDVKIPADNSGDNEIGLFHDDDDDYDAVWDDGGLKTYVPPASHVHHRRSHSTNPFTDNCQIFSSNQVNTNNGENRLVRGICDGIFEWFASDGASSDGVTLTWDPNRRNVRDAYTCNRWTGGSYCTEQNEQFNADTGLLATRISISCDEFPFGGTEEGGDWGAKYAPRRRPPTANCVPQWQQTLQGVCNGTYLTLLLAIFLILSTDNSRTTEHFVHQRGILRPRYRLK